MRLFYKNNGAISVFLSLILLPVLIFTGMVTDFTRIYGAKTQVSDAGEMAMNGALSQYSYVLKDMYGLLAMEESPEDIEDTLEAYYVQTLEGSLDDYSQLIDMESLSFTAYDVEGSELYIPEVVRQQIVEYMKYRAPVSIVNDLLEKFEILQDSDEVLDAVDAQMEYAKELSDCQDELENLYKALKKYDDENSSYSEPDYTASYDGMEEQYEEITKLLVRYAFLDGYTTTTDNDDLKELVELVITLQEDMETLTSESSIYTKCLLIISHNNQIEYLGGADSLETDNDFTADDKEELLTKYSDAIDYIEEYKEGLKSSAETKISGLTQTVQQRYSEVEDNIKLAEDALEEIDDYLEALEEAEEAWNEWGDTVEEVSDGSTKSDLMDQVTEQGQLLGNDGDSSSSDVLKNVIQGNIDYFENLKSELEKVSYYSQVIATTSTSTQLSTYLSKAKEAAATGEKTQVDSIASTMMYNYSDTSNFTSLGTWSSISDDTFYGEITEKYLNSQTEEVKDVEDGEEDTDAAADYLENKESAEVAEYTWGSSGTLPSQIEELEEDDEDVSGATDIGTESSYKKTVQKNQDALNEARDLLSGMEEIFTDQLENLYISEYIMQMFTYYTIAQDGEGGTVDVTTLYSSTGYPLWDNEAFGSEIEYILWGEETAQENVDNTLALTFAFRMLFNTITAFTDFNLIESAQGTSSALTVAAPYLYPIVYVCTTMGLALVETVEDQKTIELGYGITILKIANVTGGSWKTYVRAGDNTQDVSLNYEELLQLFLIVSLTANSDTKVLRILDCIDVNLGDAYSIVEQGYTMVGISSKVQVRTTFLQTIEAGLDSIGQLETGYYNFSYESIMGY